MAGRRIVGASACAHNFCSKFHARKLARTAREVNARIECETMPAK